MATKNFLGNDLKWFWAMKKIAPPLGMSAFPVGAKLSSKDWEYDIPFLSYWYFYGHSYADSEETEKIKEYIAGNINKDPSYPDRMARNIYFLAKQIFDQQIVIDASLSLGELVQFWKKESFLFFKMVGMLSYSGPIPIADILDEKVLATLREKLNKSSYLDDYEKYKEIVETPTRKTIVAEEQDFILANRSRLENDRTQIIKEYRAKFSFLQYHWFVGKELTDQEIVDRFVEFHLDKTNEAEAGLNMLFDDDELKLLRQLQEWIFLRTYIKDMVNLASYKLQPLLSLIAEKKGIPSEWMPYLTHDEILSLVNASIGELKNKYQERLSGYSAQVEDDKLMIGDFGAPPTIAEETKILKGSVAYKGYVIGKVKTMESPREDFGDADILVVGMTTPDFLFAMKKAKAFVTDEGGITCHAAIVAREMGKPCIIGTKIATKVLHDGDVVEVNANRGIVKILKRDK